MFKPTLRQFEYFCSLARTSSFSQSAKECLVGQSTLSSAIKDLEHGLNLLLFERTSRQVFLTAEGEHLLTYAQSMLEQQETFLEQAKMFDNTHKAPIRLGIIPTIAPFILPQLITSDHNIHFKEGLSSELLSALEERHIDIAILALPYPLKSHIKSKILFQDDLYIAEPVEHRENLPFIFLEDGHCLKDQAISSCKISPKDISHKFSATSLNSILALVEKNLGRTLIPKMSIPFFDAFKNISFSPFPSNNAYRDIALVWSNPRHTDKVHNLETFILKTIR